LGILVVGEILAVQLRLQRMHDHSRAEIVDPEIVVIAIAQFRDAGGSRLARQIVGAMVAYRGVVLLASDAQRQLRQMAQLIFALLFQRIRKVAGLHRRQTHQAAKAQADDAVDAKFDREAKTIGHGDFLNVGRSRIRHSTIARESL
jgi:hypothetical protein